jgi:hypothetical protein
MHITPISSIITPILNRICKVRTEAMTNKVEEITKQNPSMFKQVN